MTVNLRDRISRINLIIREVEALMVSGDYIKSLEFLSEAFGLTHNQYSPEIDYLRGKLKRLHMLCTYMLQNKRWSKTSNLQIHI